MQLRINNGAGIIKALNLNRPLLKLAVASEVQGEAERRTGMYN
jgi:hypothetical protein